MSSWFCKIGFFTIMVLLVGGCQTANVAKPSGLVFFPAPPEKPRVQYIGSITSPKDLPAGHGRFADFVLGPEPVHYVLVKPNGAILDGSRLYVSDTAQKTVFVYDLETGDAHTLHGDHGNGKIKTPNSIKRDEQGVTYVADKDRQAVLIYGPDEEFVKALGRPGETEPVDIAIGAKGLYVLNYKNSKVELWDRENGKLLSSIGSQGIAPGQFYFPTHLVLDAQGNIYVTDTGNFRVQKFSPDGKFLMQIGAHGDSLGKFAWPKGVGLDGAGRVYVVDSRFYNVQIFNPQGKLLMFFGGPGPDAGCLDLPSGVSVQPWPATLQWANKRLASGFDPEYLVIVVSQEGDGYVNFFAVAREAGQAGK